ncbi:MAG TPA: PAS domain S-box protein [Syntrophorhabdaceae bacterium]|jgi:PAS domain S-box-containing protein
METEKTKDRITALLAGIITGTIMILLPLLYYLFSYENITGELEAEAEINSRIITEIISKNPEMWEFEQTRLLEYLSRRPRHGHQETRRVVNRQNQRIAESADPLESPVIEKSRDLMDSGAVVGKIKISRSLRPLVNRTLLLALIVLPLGIGVFVLIRIVPIRSMYRAERRLRRSNELLRESEAKYRAVVENSLAGFYIIQDQGFRFISKRVCDIFGYTYDEMAVMDPVSMAHPDDREKIRENLQRRLTGKSDFVEYSFRAHRKDGRIITIKVSGGFLYYKGKPAAAGTILDVTREMSLESKLRQAQKMEAIGTLAGGIAHDFNNVLTIISGYAVLLKMATDSESPLRMYVDPILSSAEKGAGLTKSLLAFSRQQPVKLIPLDLNKSVKGSEEILRRLVTEEVELKTSLAPEKILIMADATQIEQILFNLVANGRDAMEKGGTLTIETGLVGLNEEFVQAHGYGVSGSYALLAVSDTGSGMDGVTRERIFDPFFTTKEFGKGTGLGLSTVYGIVKQHNGYINVSSEPGKGTIFRLYFPAVRTAPQEVDVAPRVIPGGTETILIAEDNDDVRRLVCSILSRHGYTVIEAMDGEDAIDKLKVHEEIDLVVLDSVMPKKSGREVCDEARILHPRIKVLFTSGYTSNAVPREGLREEKIDFISKPILPDEMLVKVREVLDRG